MTQRPSMLIRGPFYITILLTVLFYRRLRKLLRRRVVLSFVIVLGIVTCSVTSFHFTTLREFLSGTPGVPVCQAGQECRPESRREDRRHRTANRGYALSNQDLYRRVAPSVVLVSCPGKGYGTGFFYGRDGIIVTNHHVMQGVDARRDRHPPRPEVPRARHRGRGPANDLILLSTGIPPDEIRALTVNTSCRCRRPGPCRQPPQGLYRCPWPKAPYPPRPCHPWVGIRLATPLTYGASGSPVCNSRGEVVAIIWAGDKEDNQTGFAIPAARLSALAAKNPYPLSQMAASETLDTSILTTTSAARDAAAR